MEPLVNCSPLKAKPHMSLSRETRVNPRSYLASSSVLDFVYHLPQVAIPDEVSQSSDAIAKRLADDYKEHLVNRKKNRKAINERSYQRIIEHLKAKRSKLAEEQTRQQLDARGNARLTLLRHQLQLQQLQLQQHQRSQQQQQLPQQRRTRFKKLPTIQSPTASSWNSTTTTTSQLPRIPSGLEVHSFETKSTSPRSSNRSSNESGNSNSSSSNNTGNQI